MELIVLQAFVAEATHCVVKLVIPWRVMLAAVKQHSDTYFLLETGFKISSHMIVMSSV